MWGLKSLGHRSEMSGCWPSVNPPAVISACRRCYGNSITADPAHSVQYITVLHGTHRSRQYAVLHSTLYFTRTLCLSSLISISSASRDHTKKVHNNSWQTISSSVMYNVCSYIIHAGRKYRESEARNPLNRSGCVYIISSLPLSPSLLALCMCNEAPERLLIVWCFI